MSQSETEHIIGAEQVSDILVRSISQQRLGKSVSSSEWLLEESIIGMCLRSDLHGSLNDPQWVQQARNMLNLGICGGIAALHFSDGSGPF